MVVQMQRIASNMFTGLIQNKHKARPRGIKNRIARKCQCNQWYTISDCYCKYIVCISGSDRRLCKSADLSLLLGFASAVNCTQYWILQCKESHSSLVTWFLNITTLPQNVFLTLLQSILVLELTVQERRNVSMTAVGRVN